MLKPGYVVWVSRELRTLPKYRDWTLEMKNPTWIARDDQPEWDAAHADVVKLDQVPHPQTAIFTADHHTGYVVAMVGGSDYDRSEFNRAVQACRQPGSTYKPIYYSLGLDQGYGFDTVLDDVKVDIVDPITGEVWTPDQPRRAPTTATSRWSTRWCSPRTSRRSICSGGSARRTSLAWARRLGFTTKIFPDDALALGASCSRLDEMARAFTVFARLGTWWPRPGGREKNWVYVRRILDRAGNAVEDNTVAEDPELPAADRLDRTAALAGVAAPQAIPARTAYLMTKLLAHEVEYGFASVLRATQLNAAGKTGTSSATFDNLFIAFTSKFTTLVWMGDDKRVRALGKTDAAYMTVVPLWARYMYEAAHVVPQHVDPVGRPARRQARRPRRSLQGRARPADGPDLPAAAQEDHRRHPPAGVAAVACAATSGDDSAHPEVKIVLNSLREWLRMERDSLSFPDGARLTVHEPDLGVEPALQRTQQFAFARFLHDASASNANHHVRAISKEARHAAPRRFEKCPITGRLSMAIIAHSVSLRRC